MSGKFILINSLKGGLPNPTNAMTGWEIPIKADYITQQIIDGEIINTSNQIMVSGVLQPLKAEDVNLKPEGQRSWNWYQLHIKTSYKELQVEQMVEIDNIKYKIMAHKKYDLYGYNEYHIVRGYDE